MSRYLKRDGTQHASVPNLEEYVEVKGENLSLEARWYVTLYGNNADPSAPVGEEFFHNKPTKSQIKWCIYKHRAFSARVFKEYILTL